MGFTITANSAVVYPFKRYANNTHRGEETTFPVRSTRKRHASVDYLARESRVVVGLRPGGRTCQKMAGVCLVLLCFFSHSVLVVHAALDNVQTIYDNECEVRDANGVITYCACAGEPLSLLQSQVARFNVGVDPESATCGTSRDPYCTLGLTECSYCDAADPALRHPPEHMYDQHNNLSPNLDTWWQSVAWDNPPYPEPFVVNITLSFDQLYEMQDDMSMTFRTSRPPQITLYKSLDYGATYTPLQYYRRACKPLWDANVSREVTTLDPTEVICSQRYSQETPYQNGEVVFDVVHDRYQLYTGEFFTDFELLYSAFTTTNLNEFLTFTDLNIQLLYPATDGNEALRQPEDLLKYYYAISDITVTGACSCNLHAKYCNTDLNNETVCDCFHNTMGKNCEECKPLFNNKPWRAGHYLPYPQGTANECEGCECNDHASSCSFDLDLGFGRCNDCQHNTTGPLCETCRDGFFRNSLLSLNDTNVCIDCNCEPLGVLEGDLRCIQPSGQCRCKQLVTGRRCELCVSSYYGLLLPDQPGLCKFCGCDVDGTVGRSTVCERGQGQCPCKPNVAGRTCNLCAEGFYSFPRGRPFDDCRDCACDPGGSQSLVCDTSTGRCTCYPNLSSQYCNATATDTYVPHADANQFQPYGGSCSLDTDLLTEENPFTGRVFVRCSQNEFANFDDVNRDIMLQQATVITSYQPTVRYSLLGTQPWEIVVLTVSRIGSSAVDLAPFRARSEVPITDGCPLDGQTTYSIDVANLPAGVGLASISDTVLPLDVRCIYSVHLATGLNVNTNVSDSILLDSVLFLPFENETRAFQLSDPVTQQQYQDCRQRIAALRTRESALLEYDCRRFSFAVGAEMAQGALACDCDPVGAIPGTLCDSLGGQCQCKTGVFGRRCDECAPGFYNFTINGCLPCECATLGSVTGVCDYSTGQCPCLPNIAPAGLPNVMGLQRDLRCRSCLVNYFGFYTGLGCESCLCDAIGSGLAQCDDLGTCLCRETVNGEKCDRCQEGYYSFSVDGCTACNCNIAGSEGIACDQASGRCLCKANVFGDKCAECASDSFNLMASNPMGCQKCFCYGHSTTCTSASGFTSDAVFAATTLTWLPADPLGLAVATHVVAPSEFLGNKRSSYGQTLAIGYQTRLGAEVPFIGEQAIIFEGNAETVYYNATPITASAGYQTFSIPILETDWLYSSTQQQPNYFQFHAILANLTGLFLQRRFGLFTVDYRNIALAVARPALPFEEPVGFVENCTCTGDRNVGGLSCDQCAQGNYREFPVSADPYDGCIPCNCNSRGETDPPICDELTGECLNCKNGTNGTFCQDCAANVIDCLVCSESLCGVCADDFYGLSRDGCQACNCSSTGASPTPCNAETGQCDCQPFVVGQRCDECADNYFGMTLSGCQECDECYGLVGVEVNDLRAMRDNLTQLLGELLLNDDTDRLGLFRNRLQATLLDMQRLLSFLSEATNVQDVVRQETVRLNSTLQGLLLRLDTEASQLLNDTRDTVDRAEGHVTDGASAIRNTTIFVIEANDRLIGELEAFTAQFEEFFLSIRQVETALTNVSGSAIGDVIRVSNVVQQIETRSSEAKTTADQAYLTAQSALSIHRDTSQRINELQQFLAIVQGIGQQVALSAQYTAGNASLIQQSANYALGNASALPPIDVNSFEMAARAARIQRDSETLASQGNEAQDSSLTIVNQVNGAVLRTNQLRAQADQLNGRFSGLQARMEAANAQAQGALAQEQQAFSDASTMLDVMRNFDTRATEVELAANQSLATVEAVRTSSEQATQEAQLLQAQLQGAQSNAVAAVTTAGQALAVAQENSQTLQPISAAAATVRDYSATVLNTIQGQADNVLAVNATLVTAANARCEDYSQRVAALQQKATIAEQKTDNATRQVQETRSRIEQILADFQSVENIDAVRIAELQALVTQTRSGFDKEPLLNAVRTLNAAVQEQRVWLDNMRLQRQQLSAEIIRLRTVQDQLRTGR